MTIPELRKALTPHLSKEFFQPSPVRLVYLAVAYGFAALHFYTTNLFLSGDVPLAVWLLTLFLAANAGTFFFFSMHEILHGGVLKNKTAISVTSFFAGVPFLCSPYVWRVWHAHHHRHTAEHTDTDRPFHPEFDDPSKPLSWFNDFAKRLRYLRIQSYFVPWLVISGHHMLMLLQSLFHRGPLKLKARRAMLETFAVYALFFLPLLVVELQWSLLGFYLPLTFAHLICNCYILTNHFDNPLNTVNCPLANSTSVYLVPGVPWTHMGFGRHVEHHIYPHVSHKKLAEVRRLLLTMYPEKYQERQAFSVLHSMLSRRTSYEPIHDGT